MSVWCFVATIVNDPRTGSPHAVSLVYPAEDHTITSDMLSIQADEILIYVAPEVRSHLLFNAAEAINAAKRLVDEKTRWGLDPEILVDGWWNFVARMDGGVLGLSYPVYLGQLPSMKAVCRTYDAPKIAVYASAETLASPRFTAAKAMDLAIGTAKELAARPASKAGE